MAADIISREDARAQGLKRYFTAEECPRGHLAERYVSTKQCADCLLAWKRAWRVVHRESFNARARENRAANAEKARASTKRWQSTPEGRAVKAKLQRERRARLRGSGGTHTQRDIDERLEAQRYRCAYCRAEVRHAFEVDHIIPLALGGTNDRRNIQLVCAPCNRKKRTKSPERYARDLGMLI